MSGRVILLVEDDPFLAELTTACLQEGEFVDEVVVARDGVEAIDWLLAPERGPKDMPRLVLLDLKMPRLDGFGVLRKMRSGERTRLIPVVIVSSSNHPADMRSAYELGANGYVDKAAKTPWPDALQTVVRYWLGMNLPPCC